MIEFVTLILVVVGALNWGLIGLFKFNLVEWLANHSFKELATIIYLLVGISAVIHLFSRDYYLRFLGDCVFPCGSLSVKTPEGADTSVTITVKPNVNVVFWAAEPNTKVIETPWEAYNMYSNSGVAKSDANGTVELRFRKPASYNVPRLFNNTLQPHVHYRVCKNNGMLDRVETVFVKY